MENVLFNMLYLVQENCFGAAGVCVFVDAYVELSFIVRTFTNLNTCFWSCLGLDLRVLRQASLEVSR